VAEKGSKAPRVRRRLARKRYAGARRFSGREEAAIVDES
jgi:hypothetical protein